jgi:ABC-2 type transport system permease protein
MTVLTTAARSDPAAPTRRQTPAPLRTRAAGLLASEWIKIRSTRSTYWTLLASAVGTILICVLVARHYVTGWEHLPAIERAGFDPIDTSLQGFGVAQLAIAALGVLVISAEYATGLIRTTFSAAPKRRAVLAAKAAVFGAVALLTGELLSFTAFWVGQAILHRKHLGVSLSDPGVLRAVLAAGFYLFIAGLIGLALGTLLRYTAGAITAAIGILFLLPKIVDSLPSPWRQDIDKFIPENLISQLASTHPSPTGLPVGWCWPTLLAYPAALLLAAGYLITRRDA